jgi:alpha-L-arabinofuranosidase
VVIKALNTGPDPANVTFALAGAGAVSNTGQLTVLRSASPLDENSFEAPTKIAPVKTQVSGLGRTFTRTLPQYSLSILRVSVR